MVIEFGPDGRWRHAATSYTPDLLEKLTGDWAELVEGAAPESLVFERDARGAPAVFTVEGHNPVAIRPRLAPMPITAPDGIALEQAFEIHGVPEGATILINGVAVDTMDESGVYELTATQAGKYRIAITAAGYLEWSTTLEAKA